VTHEKSIENGTQFRLVYTMLYRMRQWVGSKVINFWQQSRAFLWLPVFRDINVTEVSGKVFLSTSNVVKLLGGQGSAPDPTGGAYSASPNSLAGGEGARLVEFCSASAEGSWRIKKKKERKHKSVDNYVRRPHNNNTSVYSNVTNCI